MKKTCMFRSLMAMGMGLILLLIPPFAATAATLDAERAQVISSDLREAMAEGTSSEYSVMVSLTNDAYDTYEAQLRQSNATLGSWTRSSIDSSDNLEEIQAQISAQRAQSRAFYQAQNQAAIEGKVDSEDVVYVSRYSPVVILSLEAVEINQLALNGQVSSISYMGGKSCIPSINENPVESDFIAPYATASASSRATAAQYYLNMINASRLQQYSNGSGIIIGMVESSIPQISYISSLNVAGYYPVTNVRYSEHASLVASIIKDIAPNATLYCAGVLTSIQDEEALTNAEWQTLFMNRIEWLLDQNVNIINMSAGVDFYIKPGTESPQYTNIYNYFSAWYDHISCYHGVTLVSAVGNDSSYGVPSSSLAYNNIAVGAVDGQGVLTYYSGYNQMLSTVAPSKPDICVPGQNICVGTLANSGTSFAAPQVTGVVALMMQRNTELITQPEAIKTVLTANVHSQYIMNTTERVYNNPYQMYGAGIVDCASIYKSLRSERYQFEYYPAQEAGDTYEYPIRLQIKATNRISLAFSRKVVLLGSCGTVDYNDNEWYDLQNIDFEIWYEGECIASSNNEFNNLKIVSVYTDQTIDCTIKIIFKEATSYGTFLAFAWNYYY